MNPPGMTTPPFLLTVLLFLVAMAARAELRAFTSIGGTTIRAEIEAVSEGQVRLRLPDGNPLEVDLSSLSAPDREFIDLWQTHPSRHSATESSPDADVASEPGAEPPPETPLSTFLDGHGYRTVRYSDEKFVLSLPVTVQGRSLTFLLNTALPFSYLHEPVASSLDLTVKPLNAVLATRDGGNTRLGESVLPGLSMGGVSLAPQRFRVANLAATGLDGSGLKAAGVLGIDFLRANDCIIDYASKTLHIPED